MKKQLLSTLAIAILTLSANSQNPDKHVESFDKGLEVTPCFLGYEAGPGAFQGNPGHDFTSMKWDSTGVGALIFKATTHATNHGPLYYTLSAGDANNCLPAEGLVDISKTQVIKIRAKASVPFKVTAYVQEGNAASWDYSKFSHKTVVMNLTTEYQDFMFDAGVLDSNIAKTGKIDPTKIGTIAFELGKVNDVWEKVTDATVSIDYIKLGSFETSVSTVNAVSFSIYPNPATDVVNVTLATADAAIVELSDVAGKVLSSQAVSGTNVVAVSTVNIPSGVYIVNVKTAKGVGSQKVVVK